MSEINFTSNKHISFAKNNPKTGNKQVLGQKSAYICYDVDEDVTKIQIFNNGECLGQQSLKGDKTKSCREQFQKKTDLDNKNIVTIYSKKGGKHPQYNASGDSLLELDANTRASVAKALVAMRQKPDSQKFFLEAPVSLKHGDGTKKSMDFETFVNETEGTGFDVFQVLNNLSEINQKAFEPSNIEKITLSGDGTELRISAKDNKFAIMDFKNGRRMVDVTEPNGMPDVCIDNNGPVIKAPKAQKG